jgi:hypothetical protein
MPREAWRDDPEYVALWREARQSRDEAGPYLVLADWLEENGHLAESWRERLRALSGQSPDVDAGVARGVYVSVGDRAWHRLLAAPPPEDLLVLFTRNVQAYQYLRRLTGRCGWDMGAWDWPSRTERAHLLAVPRLEMLASKMMTQDCWDWLTANLAGLTHLEADGAIIEPTSLGRLKHMPRLHHLSLRGQVADDPSAITTLPGLRHLALGPRIYAADRVAEMAPNAESLFADLEGLGESTRWPRLRSYRMLHDVGGPLLSTAELTALARCPALERLNVRCGEVNPSALEALAAAPHLRELKLRFVRVPVPPLDALAGAPALESLTIEGIAHDGHLEQIAGAENLRSLTFAPVYYGPMDTSVPIALGFGERGLEALVRLRHLEKLDLSGEYRGAEPPTALAELPRLERLDLRQVSMPPGSIQALKAAARPWVECLIPEEG